jgi:hypothetical protein
MIVRTKADPVISIIEKIPLKARNLNYLDNRSTNASAEIKFTNSFKKAKNCE